MNHQQGHRPVDGLRFLQVDTLQPLFQQGLVEAQGRLGEQAHRPVDQQQLVQRDRRLQGLEQPIGQLRVLPAVVDVGVLLAQRQGKKVLQAHTAHLRHGRALDPQPELGRQVRQAQTEQVAVAHPRHAQGVDDQLRADSEVPGQDRHVELGVVGDHKLAIKLVPLQDRLERVDPPDEDLGGLAAFLD